METVPKNTCVYQTHLDLRQLEHLWERVDAVGVGGERVHTLTAEDGGGHGPQSVATQVQLLQLLQSCQFTAGGGGTVISERWHCTLYFWETHSSDSSLLWPKPDSEARLGLWTGRSC